MAELQQAPPSALIHARLATPPTVARVLAMALMRFATHVASTIHTHMMMIDHRNTAVARPTTRRTTAGCSATLYSVIAETTWCHACKLLLELRTHAAVVHCRIKCTQYNSVESLACPTSTRRQSESPFSLHVTRPIHSRLPWLVSTAPPTHQSIQYQQRSPG